MPYFRMPLCLVFLIALLPAQDDELPPDEVADLVERYVERGEESMRIGNYEEARLRFKKALRRDKKNQEAALGIARAYRLVGAYDKAEKQLATFLEAAPTNRDARIAQAELRLLRGRNTEARKLARDVLKSDAGGEGPDMSGLRARLVIAESHAARGEKGKARTELDFFMKYYERRYDAFVEADFNAEKLRHKPSVARPLAEEMRIVTQALRMYVELSPLDNKLSQVAYDLIQTAQKLDPENWEVWIEYVRVTRVERGRALARARKARDLVTPKNPELADLYTEVAKSILTGLFSTSEAREMAETALQVNPKQTDARAIVARVRLEDNQYSQALEHIEAGLAVNPQHRDLLTLQATLDLLRGDQKAFEAGLAKVFQVDPKYGEAYHLAALVVVSRQRRYDRGVDLVRKGLALDPTNFAAHASLGIFLANLGRAEDARKALEESKKLLPFEHPVRENFKDVLDYVIGTMTEIKSKHFVYRVDPSEHAILSRYLPELMEECWDDMVKRYGFTPKVPVLVEIFKKADDFSVRTMGLPGIPALGACFGGLITLDSPQALPPGQFLWASTARHEFSHVMSLQLSKGQVPRWFTEGLSVYEERPLDVGWGMDGRYERILFDEYQAGSLPEIASFDAMFRSARVSYAYYIGGLMLQFLHERSGERGIVKALQLYGEDKPMREVFKESFGIELAEFDKLFAEFIGKRVANYKLVPVYARQMAPLMRRALKNPKDGDAHLKVAWAHYQRGELVDAGARFDRARKLLAKPTPLSILLEAHLARRAGKNGRAVDLFKQFFAAGGEDYEARMLMASFFAQQGNEDAHVDYLKKALAAWPFQVEGATSPYAQLRRHYLIKNRPDEARALLEKQVQIASRNIPLRMQLATEYTKLGRSREAVRTLEEILAITLYHRPAHSALLPLYRKAGLRKKAVRAAECVIALRTEKDGEEEAAEQYCDLAECLLEDGRPKEAKAALKEARGLAADLPRIAEIEKKIGQ